MRSESRGKRYNFHPPNYSKHIHPLVQRMFRIMIRHKVGIPELCDRAGLDRNTMGDWKAKTNPNIANFEAALNALGYKLVIKGEEDSDDPS